MWYHKGSRVVTLQDIPEGAIGFIYKITNTENGKFYIGKKVLFTKRKTKIGVREKAATGTKKRFKIVTKESDWVTYNGSCKELILDMKHRGDNKFHKEIIEFCCTKKYMTYAEIAHQIKEDVLTKESYNGNIMGRYYRKDMQNC